MWRASFWRFVDHQWSQTIVVGSDRKRIADRVLQLADASWRKELAVSLSPWIEGGAGRVILKSFKGTDGEGVVVVDDVEVV